MKRNSLITVGITFLFGALFLLEGIFSFGKREWKDLGLAVIGIFALTLPFIFSYLAKRVQLKIPSGFVLIGVIFIFLAQYLGEIKDFYEIFWWWDVLLHAVFGILAVLFALFVLTPELAPGEGRSKNRYQLFLALLSLTFSFAVSATWEIIEYFGDLLFSVHMVKGGLEDSMTDLTAGAVAAALTAIIYYRLIR